MVGLTPLNQGSRALTARQAMNVAPLIQTEINEVKSAEKENDSMAISIIGSGDFGRGLALRMVQCGYKVYIGSRNPEGNTKYVNFFDVVHTLLKS